LDIVAGQDLDYISMCVISLSLLLDRTRGEDGGRKTGYTGHGLESRGEAQKRHTAEELAGNYT